MLTPSRNKVRTGARRPFPGHASPAFCAQRISLMRIERVRRYTDRIEAKRNALARSGILDIAVEFARPFNTAEFLGQIRVAVLAFARQGRIELERPPMTSTSTSSLDRISSAFSKRFLPMKHHGHMTSETMSIWTAPSFAPTTRPAADSRKAAYSREI
jgi:hypothetical protein